MKFDILAVASLLFLSSPSFAHPQPQTDILVRDDAAFEPQNADFIAGTEDLWKRKGGGGGGGKGGGGGGSSSSGGGSSGSSGSSSGSGSSGGSSGSRPGSSGSGSTGNSGGSSRQGSGVQPSFGGGKYYGGGATKPYAAGSPSPRGIAPFFIGGAALAFLPGLLLLGAFAYPYHHPYSFRNRTAPNNETQNTNTRRYLWTRQENVGVMQTKPVTCYCAQNLECGCDDNEDTAFLDQLIGDGTYSKLNHTLVNVVDINGTSTIVLDGTLPNGTTVAEENAAGGMQGLMQSSGYLVMVALTACTVLLV